MRRLRLGCYWLLGAGLLTGCQTIPPGTMAPRRGDEIVAAGQFVHTGTPVVLWLDPGGYDAYRVERRFAPVEESSWERSAALVKDLSTPNRYGMRRSPVSEARVEQIRGGGWDLPLLQEVVDQFVIHYDACGTSRQCFKVLHDLRDLSVHFLLDVDGTVYQTLDLKERAWHATSSNSRAVGIEIAHIGAYNPDRSGILNQWYATNSGGTILTIPGSQGDGGVRTRGYVGHPARPELVSGSVQGRELVQYDFTPEQYRALIRLTAALCKLFPNLKCDYPRDADGKLMTRKLADEPLSQYRGLLGHFHIQTNKVDPGPAFQWDYFLRQVRKLLREPSENFERVTRGNARMQPEPPLTRSGISRR